MFIFSINFHEYTIPDRAFRTRIEITKNKLELGKYCLQEMQPQDALVGVLPLESGLGVLKKGLTYDFCSATFIL